MVIANARKSGWLKQVKLILFIEKVDVKGGACAMQFKEHFYPVNYCGYRTYS